MESRKLTGGKMKKFLLFIASLFVAINSYAGIITYDTLTSDAVITYSFFNTEFNRAYNEINGNLSSVNFLDKGITEPDFADAINPRVRDNELIGDMTYSGMLPPTATGLSSTITSGTSYVSGYRVSMDSTAQSFTNNTTSWLYIGKNSDYKVLEGVAQPTTPTGYLLLAKVVTSGGNITSVTDLRQLTPTNLRIYLDYKNGLVISRDVASANKIIISRGEIDLGTDGGKLRRNIVSDFVDFSASGAQGYLDTGTLAAETYYYIHAVADSSNSSRIKFLASLSSGDITGYTSGTNRLIGWCYAQSASVISPDSVGAYKGRGGDAPNEVIVERADVNQSLASGVHMKIHPSIRIATSGRPVEIKYHISTDQTSATGEVQAYIFVSADGVALQSEGMRTNDAGSFTASGSCTTRKLGEGTHYIDVSITPASTLSLISYNIAVEEK